FDHDLDIMQAVYGCASNSLTPLVLRQVLTALTFVHTVVNIAFGAKRLDSARSEKSGSGLHFGFFAGTQGGGDGLSEADESDSENESCAHDFDEGERGRTPHPDPLPIG